MAPQTKDMRRPDLSESSVPHAPPARRTGDTAAPIEWRPALRGPDLRLCLPSADMLQNTVVPYQEPAAAGDKPEFASTLASTMPMAAMFTRNKFVGWCVAPFVCLEASPRRMRTPESPRIPRREIASNHTMAVARTRVLLTSHPLQGRRRLLHPELPRRERRRQEGLEHAGLLFHPHVRYVASVPKPRAHSASVIQASAVLTTNAVMALAVTYLPLFLPPRPGMPGSATEAPAPVPPQ